MPTMVSCYVISITRWMHLFYKSTYLFIYVSIYLLVLPYCLYIYLFPIISKFKSTNDEPTSEDKGQGRSVIYTIAEKRETENKTDNVLNNSNKVFIRTMHVFIRARTYAHTHNHTDIQPSSLCCGRGLFPGQIPLPR